MAHFLFVTGTSVSVEQGSGTYVGISVLRDALAAQGHSVEILAPSGSEGPTSFWRRLLFNARARRRAGPWLRRGDAIVGFDLDGFLLPDGCGLRIASIKGVVAEEARYERGVPRLRLTVESFLERLHVRRVDRVIVTSLHSQERLIAEYGVPGERVSVVPELIDLARWRRALDAAAELPSNGKSILCVAHLYPRKDVATLLTAMSRLPKDAVLRVVGGGPELARLRQQAQGLGRRVEFLGHVAFSRLVEEYRRADLFCLPSRQEGFGIVFLEAMAARLPIVAVRAAAVPEVVGDDCGILVPPACPEELAGALERLLEDPQRRSRMGEAGARRVQRFDAPRVAAEFLRAVMGSGPHDRA